MDYKTHILTWEHAIEDNPAILVLGIIVLITGAFIAAIFLDGYLSRRKKKPRKKG